MLNRLIPTGLLTLGLLLYFGVLSFEKDTEPKKDTEVDLVVLQKLVLEEVAWEVERDDSKLQTLNDVFDCLNLTVARVKKDRQDPKLDELRVALGTKINIVVPPTTDSSGEVVDVALDTSKRNAIAQVLREFSSE